MDERHDVSTAEESLTTRRTLAKGVAAGSLVAVWAVLGADRVLAQSDDDTAENDSEDDSSEHDREDGSDDSAENESDDDTAEDDASDTTSGGGGAETASPKHRNGKTPRGGKQGRGRHRGHH